MKNIRLITSLVFCVCAIATIVVQVRSCRSRAVPPPPEPLSAAERNDALIRERMADPNYTNALALLADRQAQLARLSHEAAEEFAAWSTNFFASNAAARELSESLRKLAGEGMSRTNADFAAKVAELESLIAADPQGKNLLDKRNRIAEAMAEHGRVARAFIGGRAYRQMREHAGEERAAAERQREKLIAEGKIKPPPPPPSRTFPTNMPPPRKEGWWTNQPPAAAGSPVPSSQFTVQSSGGTRSGASTGGAPSQRTGPETRNPEPGTK